MLYVLRLSHQFYRVSALVLFSLGTMSGCTTQIRRLQGLAAPLLADTSGVSCSASARPFGGGDGTVSSPYLVCAREHLDRIRSNSAYLNKYFKQSTDIDLGGSTNPFSPIANFSGSYDGGGYTLQNFVYRSPNGNAGLFMDLSGNVHDLVLDRFFVRSPLGSAGALAAQQLSAAISNITVTNSVVVGGAYAGGIAGLTGGSVTDASFSGTVAGYGPAGGVVGYAFGSLARSSSAGMLIGSVNLGGIAGVTASSIDLSYSTMNIVTNFNLSSFMMNFDEGNVGGVSGVAYGTTADSSFLGSIISDDPTSGMLHSVGGLHGYLNTGASLIRSMSLSPSISTAILTRAAQATTDINAGIGTIVAGSTISNSFYFSNPNVVAQVDPGLTLVYEPSSGSTPHYNLPATFGAFTFSSVWKFLSGIDFPLLAFQSTSTPFSGGTPSLVPYDPISVVDVNGAANGAGSFNSVDLSVIDDEMTIVNTSGASVVIDAVSLADGYDFALLPVNLGHGDCAIGASLASNSSCTIPLRFSPQMSGYPLDGLIVDYTLAGVSRRTAHEISGISTLADAFLEYFSGTVSESEPGQFVTDTFQFNNIGTSGNLTIQSVSVSNSSFSITGGTCAATATVAAYSSCTVNLRFSPTAAGTFLDAIHFVYVDDFGTSRTYDFPVSGISVVRTPVLAYVSGSISATGVTANSTSTFVFRNDGDAAATISSVSLSSGVDYAVTGGTCAATATVAVAGTCTVFVRFAPGTAGTRTDTLSIAYTSPGGASYTLTRALSGVATATDATLGLIGGTLTTAVVNVASSAAFTFSNSGVQAATISARSVSGADYSITAGTCIVTSTFTTGQTCTVFVQILSATTGTKVGTLTVDYTNAQGAARSVSVPLSVVVTNSDADLVATSSTINNGDVNLASSSTIGIDNVDVGAGTISSVALTTGTYFSVTGGSCNTVGYVVAGGAHCTLLVQFAPNAAGAFSDTLTVGYTNLDGQAKTLTIPLTATGTQNPAVLSAPTLTVSDITGYPWSHTVTVTNSGPIPTTISSISIGAGTFALNGGTCAVAGSLAVGATCTVGVTFTPSSVTTFSETLSIGYTNPASTLSVALDGTGLVYPYPFDSGLGTTTYPFFLSNCTQLGEVRNYSTNRFKQSADIDCGGVGTPFTPIASFSGNYDGQNNKIQNLYYHAVAPAGLFSSISGTVSNLILENVDYSGTSVGPLAVTLNAGTVTNVSVTSGTVVGTTNVGGLIGVTAIGSTISQSSSAATVSGNVSIGGLVGFLQGTTLSTSYATGNVTAATYLVGGLVGQFDRGGSITDCHATGNVSGSASGGIGDTGGLVGYIIVRVNGDAVSITNSYATGTVSGILGVGGLVGGAENRGELNANILITNSYATGAVTGTNSQAGGLVGNGHIGCFSGTIRESFATGDVAGGVYVGGLVGYACGIIRDSFAGGSVVASGTDKVGGLVGWNTQFTPLLAPLVTTSGEISRSYSSALVVSSTGGVTTNGSVGQNDGLALSNVYFYDNAGSPGNVPTDPEATSLSSAQMGLGASFTGFDFATTPVWGLPTSGPVFTSSALLAPVPHFFCGTGSWVCP